MQRYSPDFQENIIFSLRALYSRRGYRQYRMSKFEEYDLYARNKDFLISDRVITFTDPNGKLMALKPDVTLSIVKNSKDLPETVQKLYYHENVYRVTKGSHTFKEITQLGLECLGKIDTFCILEVLTLAAQSLRTVSSRCILNLSHQGVLSQMLDRAGIPEEKKDAALFAISRKNAHEFTALCEECGIPEETVLILKKAVSLCGEPQAVLPELIGLLEGLADTQPLSQLLAVVEAVSDPLLRAVLHFDFSVVDDVHYYNGIVFKGFLDGIPGSVLSGGQYDRLMRKLNRRSNAIGFAVYTDQLSELDRKAPDFDVDTVLLYEEGADPALVAKITEAWMAEGKRVLAQTAPPSDLRYRQLQILKGNEVITLENNA